MWAALYILWYVLSCLPFVLHASPIPSVFVWPPELIRVNTAICGGTHCATSLLSNTFFCSIRLVRLTPILKTEGPPLVGRSLLFIQSTHSSFPEGLSITATRVSPNILRIYSFVFITGMNLNMLKQSRILLAGSRQPSNCYILPFTLYRSFDTPVWQR